MPRLRNTATGAVVNVNDATAARLGSGWAPVETKQDKRKSEK